MLNENLFDSGTIYMVTEPVPARLGISGLFDKLISSQFHVEVSDKEEFYVVMLNAARNRLRILHADETGITMIVKALYKGRFKFNFSSDGKPMNLTRQQLQRLVLDGTSGDDQPWNSYYLKRKLMIENKARKELEEARKNLEKSRQ